MIFQKNLSTTRVQLLVNKNPSRKQAPTGATLLELHLVFQLFTKKVLMKKDMTSKLELVTKEKSLILLVLRK